MGVRIERFLEQSDECRGLVPAAYWLLRQGSGSVVTPSGSWPRAGAPRPGGAALEQLPTLARCNRRSVGGGAGGIGLVNWNWRVVHQSVSECFGVSLNRGSCLNYLGWGLPSSALKELLERKRWTLLQCFEAYFPPVEDTERRTRAAS